MTKNQELVNYFACEFYKVAFSDLSHLASSSFTFTINSSDPFSFREFAERRSHLFQNTLISFGAFVSSDDTNFIADIEILTLEGDLTKGTILFKIENDLLQLVDATYDLDADAFEIFQNNIFQGYTPTS